MNQQYKKVKVWWLRKGGEGFLVSNLWANGANARLTAKSLNFRDTGKHTGPSKYQVIPCVLLISKK